MRQIRTYLFTALLVCLVLWGIGPEVQAAQMISSGSCGEAQTWVLTDDGTLTISGTGEMADYSSSRNPAPWKVHSASIRHLRVEAGITGLSGNAFSGCEQLEDLFLADTVASIGAGCFSGCSGLKEVVLPPLLTELSPQLFYLCTALESVTIGERVTYIWDSAFGWCEALREVRIPDSVRIIGHSAFYYCSGLEQVIFGCRVSSLDLYAFEGCESLTEIVFPDSLRVIGERAFGNCDRLESVKLNEGLTEISSSAFSWCGALTSIEIPSTVKRINDNAFLACSSLKTVILPEGLEAIDYSAFAFCHGLESVLIPASVRYLGNGVFNGAKGLKTLHLLGDAPELGEQFFRGFPEGVTLCADETGSGWDSPAWKEQKLTFCGFSTVRNATCTQRGTVQIICSHCDLDYACPIPAGHSYDLWYTAREPSETEGGLWERKCRVCGETEQWEIPPAEQKPLISQNDQAQNYTAYYANPIRSWLRDNGDGTLTRIEAREDGVSVEVFDESYRLLSRKVLPMELPLFGGFYEGEDRFYLVFGQTNPEEDDDREVIRVVCYTKDWNRQGHASQLGYDITVPFDAGSLRMVQVGDTLYLLTAREMYQTSDGKNHQSNLLLRVPISSIADGESHILPNADYDSWYVSHSFNQFLLADGDRVLSLDHGDANPRSAIISEIGKETRRVHAVMRFADSGRFHYNATGASLGAFLKSDSAYLTAGSSIVQDGTVEMNGQRNIFLGITTRDSDGNYATRINWITDYPDGTGLDMSTPHLVRISENRFLLLWNEGEEEDRVLRYVFLDGSGEMTGSIYSQNQAYVLSDCVPVVTGGKVCWYITLNSGPVFFEIPLDTPWDARIISPEITITLQDEAGGKLDQTTLTGFYGSPLGPLPVPERKSAYIFRGWRSDNRLGFYTEGMILDQAADFTLYASWETEQHTHEYELEWEKEADCENPQTAYLSCRYCDSGYTRTSGTPAHSWDEGTLALAPTCAEEGQTLYRCTRCSAEKTEPIPTAEHEYELTGDQPADCFNPHTLIYTCRHCAAVYSTAEGSTVHTWDEGTLVVPSNCMQKGQMLYTCTLCQKERTEQIPVSGHAWQDVTIPATCTEDGRFLRVCPDCGKEVQYGSMAAPGHAFDKGICLRCGEWDPEHIPFTDVGDTDYFRDPVRWAVGQGITAGTSDTTFSPHAPCTRAQVVTFLWRAMGQPKPETTENPFSDVTPGDYYHQAVLWAVENGITAGTSPTTFAPSNPCTRGQVVTFLYRAMK